MSREEKHSIKRITKPQPKKHFFCSPSFLRTNDHLRTMRLLIEKCNEFKIKIALAFVDFEKAFDSVELRAILDALDKILRSDEVRTYTSMPHQAHEHFIIGYLQNAVADAYFLIF